MASVEAAVVHDHDYCITKEKEIEVVPISTINQAENSTLLELDSSLCVSPAYSCDSGIDSFANDLTHDFEKENNDLISFLLDEQGFLDLDSDKLTEANHKEQNATESSALQLQHSELDYPKSALAPTTNSFKRPTLENRKKNAENARENRRKKKEYIQHLEKEVHQLQTDKNLLISKSTKLERKVVQLEEEVEYLKSVIENQSMLSKLLRNVSMTPGISLSTSFCSSRKSLSEDSENGKENTVSTRSSRKRQCVSEKGIQNKKKPRQSGSSGGICLHVKQNKVSLEFCQICSKISED